MTRTPARNQTLFDVFITALHGGIGHWSQCKSYRCSDPNGEPDLDGFEAVIRTEGAERTVNANVIAKGLSLIRRGKVQINPTMRRNIVHFDRTNGEQGDIDALAADAVVQVGIFGEIVFG
jgi:hypothetical protein|tara:strand:+ start:811 stop:1170 length:360 start_codon:yes stop_codon:yes gene_type:complete